jgi:endonuclease YncB( thermonuclease family)
MRSLLLLLPLLAAGVARAGTDDDPDGAAPAEAAPQTPGPATATVVSVYDGDTFTLATGDRVRLKGANTPELKPAEDYGVEAREATKAFVSGKTVELRYGPVVRDGYGRLIAGVYVDGQSLAEHLLELGLAHIFVIPPDATDQAPFIAAQERARQAHRGIWSTPRYAGDLHITSFHANADGDDRENVNGEYLRVCNVSAKPIDLAAYRIADINGNSWNLPSLVVPPGNTFKIHSGKGANQADPDQQLEVFLGSADPIWNNKMDRATIYDRYGRMVDTRDHAVEKETP